MRASKGYWALRPKLFNLSGLLRPEPSLQSLSSSPWIHRLLLDLYRSNRHEAELTA